MRSIHTHFFCFRGCTCIIHLQVRFTYAHPRLGTWANWQPGGAEGMLIMPSRDDGSLLSDEEATDLFPKGMFECLFPWFRITPVPDMPGDDDDVEEALAE